MAFSAAKTGESVFGNLRAVYGTYEQGNGDDGGDITPGLSQIVFFHASAAFDVEINCATGVVSIETADPGKDVDGFWLALGY